MSTSTAGARVTAATEPGEVWVTRTVRDLVAGSGIEFEPRGPHALKGISEERDLYAADAGAVDGESRTRRSAGTSARSR